jgi:ABC-type multidrug transport system ATPase subunit
MLIYDIQDLVKVYPGQSQPVNDRITLQIHEGEIFGILGDNGAGKSTLVRQMVNLLPSSSGTITFLGKPVTTIPQIVQLNVGYMPQESGAVKNLTYRREFVFHCPFARHESARSISGTRSAAAPMEDDRMAQSTGCPTFWWATATPAISGGNGRFSAHLDSR